MADLEFDVDRGALANLHLEVGDLAGLEAIARDSHRISARCDVWVGVIARLVGGDFLLRTALDVEQYHRRSGDHGAGGIRDSAGHGSAAGHSLGPDRRHREHRHDSK